MILEKCAPWLPSAYTLTVSRLQEGSGGDWKILRWTDYNWESTETETARDNEAEF